MAYEPRIAYFSMEIGIDPAIPTYAGGLGILAGDMIRSAADLKIGMAAVTLLHREGYFYQRLDPEGRQMEEPVKWVVEDFLEEMPQRISVALEGRIIWVRCFRYEVAGIGGFRIPVYLLDTDLAENSEGDRRLTHQLYGGDSRYRLCQEVILGIGGVRMLRALGYSEIERFHMNEGHAALLTLELLEEEAKKAGREEVSRDDIQAVRHKCVFTTHTPVPAGHDQFPMDLVARVLGDRPDFFALKDLFSTRLTQDILAARRGLDDVEKLSRDGNTLNMTYLALSMSAYVNGVAKRHGEISKLMFADYLVDAITNGVHAATWTSYPLQALFDRYIPGWRQDNFTLRYAVSIPKEELWQAHMQEKRRLLQYVNRETNAGMDVDVLTIGFARRATAYKRADLIFSDMGRLRAIARQVGPFQLIYAGKAHPQDQGGKEVIRRVFEAMESLKEEIRIAYLQNYDAELGKSMVAGVDLWLNTPRRPFEASGTSGMKAALNGIPSLSVLDGWWIEGHIEGVTGWSIGEDSGKMEEDQDRPKDAASLYDKLERVIIPLFYRNREHYLDIMRRSIALNGSFFNTERMLREYVRKAYS
jgi:glycogen phosphorylase